MDEEVTTHGRRRNTESFNRENNSPVVLHLLTSEHWRWRLKGNGFLPSRLFSFFFFGRLAVFTGGKCPPFVHWFMAFKQPSAERGRRSWPKERCRISAYWMSSILVSDGLIEWLPPNSHRVVQSSLPPSAATQLSPSISVCHWREAGDYAPRGWSLPKGCTDFKSS